MFSLYSVFRRSLVSPLLWFLPLCLVLTIYSYVFVDLNLTLSSSAWYLSFQEVLTYFGYYQRFLSSIVYVLLICALCLAYIGIIPKVSTRKMQKRDWGYLLCIGILLMVAYPAFSYDIFNYLFNAKMVLVYGVDPHTHAAIEFAQDPWLRFMRNVHTPAPYAYGWTLLSLIPGLATLTKVFTFSLLAMKAWLVGIWLATLWILDKILSEFYPQQQWRYWLFALSPLVLIENIVVGHNDLAMMLPALASFWFLLKSEKSNYRYFLLSLLFLGISVSIKYATIVLLPLWLVMYWKRNSDTAGIASIILFLLPFTRPDQLHSWYLIWAFTFAVLSRNKAIMALALSLSLGALLRYIPYIYTGSWDGIYWLRNSIWIASLSLYPFFYNYLKKIAKGT